MRWCPSDTSDVPLEKVPLIGPKPRSEINVPRLVVRRQGQSAPLAPQTGMASMLPRSSAMLTSKHNINATIFMAAFCPDNLWGDRSAAVQPLSLAYVATQPFYLRLLGHASPAT